MKKKYIYIHIEYAESKLIKHLVWVEDVVGVEHLLKVAHPGDGNGILGIVQIILLEEADAVLGTHATLQLGRVLVDKGFDAIVDLLVELFARHVQMQVGIPQVAVTTDNGGKGAAAFAHHIDNAVEVAQWQRDVVLEAETLLDQSQWDHLAHLPDLSHLAGLASDSAIDNLATLHAQRNELVKFLLVVGAIAAGSLDEHVEGVSSYRGTIRRKQQID